MGARPIALMNSLRFGAADHPRTRFLVNGVVDGISNYGNCTGVPTVGGEIYFDPCYNGNILVNVFCLGLVPSDKIFLGNASGVGNPVIYFGSKTGRDGIHGASMASSEFDESSEEKRPTVQVGDPFAEKLLIEACLELMNEDWVVGIQDMGAAGLTCSTFEMAGRGGTGIDLELSRVPKREEGMTPYDILLSESQERMTVAVKPEHLERFLKLSATHAVVSTVIGRYTDSGKLHLTYNGKTCTYIDIDFMTSAFPQWVFEAEWLTPEIRGFFEPVLKTPSDYAKIFTDLLSRPNISSKEWITRQYDHEVQGTSVIKPLVGADRDMNSDAGVIRPVLESEKGLAFAQALLPTLFSHRCLPHGRMHH